MLADRIYKISFLGELESIQPNPETMLYFIQHFGEKGFVPSLYAEVITIPNTALHNRSKQMI